MISRRSCASWRAAVSDPTVANCVRIVALSMLLILILSVAGSMIGRDIATNTIDEMCHP